MGTHTFQRIEFINIGDAVREIERKFAIDPYHRDWKGRQEINVRCPSCKDHKYHLGLNFAKNAYNCFRCPFQGRLSDFLRKNGIKYETKSQVYRPDIISATAPKITIPIDFSRHENFAYEAKAYMASRGFDLRFLKKNFKIWPITNPNHYYFGYIIIALNDYAFYARKYTEKAIISQKHIIRKSDPKMKLYYAYEKNNSKTVLVVESMFNLMKAAQFGYNAVCIFGKGNWAAFVEYIKKHNPLTKYCLCFDKDVALKEIEQFTKRIFGHYEKINLSWIDSTDMCYNDIADIKTKEELINMIDKRRSADEIFISSMI